MNTKINNRELRYNLARELARYFIFHLKEELCKPTEVTQYTTLEGQKFSAFTEQMIDKLRYEFVDLEETTPSFNIIKRWWEIQSNFLSAIMEKVPKYEESTFKLQNQLMFFKIMDIKFGSQTLRNQFQKEMRSSIQILKKKGRKLNFESILSGESNMYPLVEIIARRGRLPINLSKKLLYEQNTFIQKIAYDIIQGELKESLKKTEEILKAILPEQIVEEIRNFGKVEPRSIPSVSIMFCDLANFTKIASGLTPSQLLSELDSCFSHFDKITKMLKLEKIKTIGDSYMAAAGFEPNLRLHAVDSILCGIRIQEFMRKYIKSQKKKNLPAWKVRIGIHSGPVVAGILGVKRFNYDIWGDSVNTAQRMEANGENERINVSEETYQLAKNFFSFKDRGLIEVKGKGLIQMYFIRGILPELSLYGNGKTPNAKFRALYRSELLKLQEKSRSNFS